MLSAWMSVEMIDDTFNPLNVPEMVTPIAVHHLSEQDAFSDPFFALFTREKFTPARQAQPHPIYA